jgi:hypothetical protein
MSFDLEIFEKKDESCNYWTKKEEEKEVEEEEEESIKIVPFPTFNFNSINRNKSN